MFGTDVAFSLHLRQIEKMLHLFKSLHAIEAVQSLRPRSLRSLWARRDLNPHGFLHTLLKRACLPITPLALVQKNPSAFARCARRESRLPSRVLFDLALLDNEKSFDSLAREKQFSRSGAPGGNRTPNPLVRSQVLYPLSYGRSVHRKIAQFDI